MSYRVYEREDNNPDGRFVVVYNDSRGVEYRFTEQDQADAMCSYLNGGAHPDTPDKLQNIADDLATIASTLRNKLKS